MKKRENQILEKDYERYTVHLPWNIILKGKSNKYIYSELEKVHPCFSDEWFINKKITIKKTGIESDVVVVNKFTLADYKQRFSKNKLWLENLEGRKFTTKSQVKPYEVFLIIFGVCIIGAGFSLKSALDTRAKENVTEQNEVVQKKIIRSGSVQAFLDFVEKNNGRFTTLKWNSDGYTETFTADLMYLFPEQMFNQKFSENIQVGNVQYKNGIPYMTVTIKDLCEACESKESSQNSVYAVPEKNTSRRTLIRQVFKDFKIDLQEEIFKRLEFNFSCSTYSDLNGENFLEVINNLAKTDGYAITKLELTKNGKQNNACGFSGVISFDERMTFKDGINLEALAWRSNLIIEKSKNQLSISPALISQKNNPVSNKGNLLGEISKADGTKIRFYKNKQGKVIKELN